MIVEDIASHSSVVFEHGMTVKTQFPVFMLP